MISSSGQHFECESCETKLIDEPGKLKLGDETTNKKFKEMLQKIAVQCFIQIVLIILLIVACIDN